jgi:hypothetical protein
MPFTSLRLIAFLALRLCRSSLATLPDGFFGESGATKGDGASTRRVLHGEQVAKQRGPVDFPMLAGMRRPFGAPKLHAAGLEL